MSRPPPVRDVAGLLATWCGIGLVPWAPGTWGSLAALAMGAGIVFVGGPFALAGATVAMLCLGLWASDRYAVRRGLDDPGAVVIDEVAGQWLAMLFVPPGWLEYALVFVAFRAFDITKVWPVSLAERRLRGAWGIMADDLVAGLYAGASVAVILWAIGKMA